VIELLEPSLATGALVVADNTNSPNPALSRPVRNPDNGLYKLQLPGRESDSMKFSAAPTING